VTVGRYDIDIVNCHYIGVSQILPIASDTIYTLQLVLTGPLTRLSRISGIGDNIQGVNRAGDTELSYMTPFPYAAQAARGVRFGNEVFVIEWHAGVHVVSQVDRSWRDLSDELVVSLGGQSA